jgi:hypothetical protein
MRTDEALRRSGWSHPVYYVIDDEDPTANEYRKKFGADNVITFCKQDMAARVDAADTTGDMRTILHARNAAFDIAKQLNLDYHFQLDDDYREFYHRRIVNGSLLTVPIRNLESVIDAMLHFLDVSGAATVAMSQPGDHIGGAHGPISKQVLKRKAMNSFLLRTARRFDFVGRLNDDVNTYVTEGSRGRLFFTLLPVAIDAPMTQQQTGGITEAYRDGGTYVKSFTTVMMAPSCVDVTTMGWRHQRIHHNVRWNNAVPKIISGTYAKHPTR